MKESKGRKATKQEQILVTGSIKKRMLITVGLIACGFCLLVINLARISILKHDEYLRYATSQQLRDISTGALRGSIYDTNMNLLANSAPVWTVGLRPKDLEPEQYALIAQHLSEILDMDYDNILEKCKESNYYSTVKRKVDQPLIDAIREFMVEHEIVGIQFDADSKRYYPNGNFAAQLLGFVGTDNQGLEGIELYYDTVLSGTPGRKLSATNAAGGDMYYDYEVIYDSEPGYSLVLTIDNVIQHYLEKHLEAALIEHNIGNRATGIVMNVNTGEILAMATKGDYDPNDFLTIFDEEERIRINAIENDAERSAALTEAQRLQWRNKAIADIYEPGSVFKIVTASAALETGIFNLNSTFTCTGSIQVGGHTMGCVRTTGHGTQDFTQAIINSCNPSFVQMGHGIGAENFYRYFEAFGLAEKTGIDLPAEAQSIYYTAENLGTVELASCSFGQSNSVTPLQMITAACAVVNGGYLVQPHVVRQIIDNEGNIVESFDTTVVRQVISAETSKIMAGVMEQVVMRANGQNAYVAGFRIGGKSGTSQKLSGADNVYIASFCAIAPADDPEIAVLILLDEPHSYSIYGGVLAAPIAGAIMSEVLPYIGVDAIYTDSELAVADIGTPNVIDYSLSNAYAALQKSGLNYQVIGGGTTVIGQFPTAGQSIPKGSIVIIYTETGPEKVVTVPDISGRSIESARTLLRSVGLNLRVEGSNVSGAVAVSQNIAVGAEVVAGTVITVDFINNIIDD